MKGPIFVTVDALDGVGKTTLMGRLADRIHGIAMDTPGPALRSLRQEVLDGLAALIPPPDVAVLLTLDESERVGRLLARGEVTAADRETLDPAFRDRVLCELRSRTDGAVERVVAALLAYRSA